MRAPSRLALLLARRNAIFTSALVSAAALTLELIARTGAPMEARTIAGALTRTAGLGLASLVLTRVAADPRWSRAPGRGAIEGRRAALAALDAPTAALLFFASGLGAALAVYGAVIGWDRFEAIAPRLLRTHAPAIVAFASCLALAGAGAASRRRRVDAGTAFLLAAPVTCLAVSWAGGTDDPAQTVIVAALTALLLLPLLSIVEHWLAAERDAATSAALDDRRALDAARTANPGALAIVTSDRGALAITRDAGALAIARDEGRSE